MALYRYSAFSADGKKVSGTIDAPTLQSAKDQLSRQGIYPITITATSQEAQLPWWRRLFGGGVSEKEKILFTRQLAVLLKAGVPLLQALELLTEQFEGNTRSLIVSVKDAIKEGGSFADALARFPKTFDIIYVQLVRAGEASGKLDTILNRLVMYLERRAEIAKRVKSALRNPMIQLVVAALVVGVMMIFVVPQLAENFAGQGKELPGPTQLVLTLSGILRKWYILLIGLGIALIAAFRWWRSTPSGARILDQIKLRIPMIKYFSRTNAVVQFSYTLGILLESGVNLAEALDIVVDSIDNRILADTLNEARDKIIKQGRIAQYLKQTGLFPPIAIYLINTGEQSGQLDTMLLTVASQYEEELSDLTDSLTARLGPILLIVMAIIVGFIVIAIALPIMQMGDLAGA